jgi:hypothetical protein
VAALSATWSFRFYNSDDIIARVTVSIDGKHAHQL